MRHKGAPWPRLHCIKNRSVAYEFLASARLGRGGPSRIVRLCGSRTTRGSLARSSMRRLGLRAARPPCLIASPADLAALRVTVLRP